ncbi:hypothetical protein J6590_029988 [Homalodisca vitripennis]|nr:hypothetical protein J6590_029988 [Homalodisca vitripennis]
MLRRRQRFLARTHCQWFCEICGEAVTWTSAEPHHAASEIYSSSGRSIPKTINIQPKTVSIKFSPGSSRLWPFVLRFGRLAPDVSVNPPRQTTSSVGARLNSPLVINGIKPRAIIEVNGTPELTIPGSIDHPGPAVGRC